MVMDKAMIVRETKKLVFLTVYLTLFLSSLTVYHSLILHGDILTYFRFGYNFVEALVLAKIILLGQMLKLGDKYEEKSLIIPVLYKAVVFSLFVFLFTGLEHFVLGLFKGDDLLLLWKEFTEQKWIEAIGKLLITFIFFIPLFSFLELKRIVGDDKVFALFFRRNKTGS